MKKQLLSAAFTLALATLAPQAKAASIYTLTDSDAFGTGTFGTVTLLQQGANTVQVTVALNGPYVFASANGEALLFNLTQWPGQSVTISNYTSGFSFGAGGTAAPFGSFDLYASCGTQQQCVAGAHNSLQFTVSTTGLTEASFAEKSVLPPGSQTAYFASDILNTQTGSTGSVGAIAPPSTVPEPLSMGFMGAGLLVIGVTARRRNKA